MVQETQRLASSVNNHVCLVDDDPSVLRAIGWLLASEGYQIRGFNVPQEFLHHALSHPVPLVVLDMWMEGMSGLEVQAQLREISPETKVIVMTANSDPTTRQCAEDQGATAFFIKPFDTERFVQAVAMALGAGGSHP